MGQKTIKLNKEQIEQFEKAESSIQHTSILLGQISIQKRELESNLASLYNFRDKTTRELISNSDIDESAIVNVAMKIDTGELIVGLSDTDVVKT